MAERRCSNLSVTLHSDKDVTPSVVFKTEQNDRLKYECPLIKKLRELQVRVDELLRQRERRRVLEACCLAMLSVTMFTWCR
jgi:hypothetical protein